MSTVDILLATYNGATFLPVQLASLEAQTHDEWRLILRDDGSGDGSKKLVRAWADRTGRELVVVEDGSTRVGPAESFARLLARSDAPYFAFCDQDDFWEPEKISRLLAAADVAGDGPVLAHCDLAVVGRDLDVVAPSLWQLRNNTAELRRAEPGHRAHLLFQNQVTGCAMLGNAALREAMLPMPSDASMHDWWAALTAGFIGRIVLEDRPLVRYRQHGGNTLGAQSRSIGTLFGRVLRSPWLEMHHTRAEYAARARQAAAAIVRFGHAMTPEEMRFAKDIAGIDYGLKRRGGWRLLFWALLVRRRWPIVAVLTITTVAGRAR